MKSNWNVAPLRELVGYISKGIAPSYAESETETTIRVLNQKCNRNFQISYSESRLHDTLRKRVPSERYVQQGDILINSTGKGTAGRIAQISDVPCDTTVDGHMIIIRANDKVTQNYLGYALKAHQWEMLQLDEGSTGQTELNRERLLDEIMICFPKSLTEQNEIILILEKIDQKLLINERINDNLQQQAFAIFDRQLSNNHSSECYLSQIAIINPKRILKKNEPARCINMALLSTSGSFPNGWEIKSYNGGMRFSNGDTLLARITPCLENGKTAYIDFLDDGEVAFGSTEYVVIASQGKYPPEFFYCLARYPSFVEYAVKNMNGSSGRQRVSAETIGNYVLPVLTDDELSEFRSTVPSLFKAMKNNSIENMSLAQLRDTLLPKLMSGEIDVSNIL